MPVILSKEKQILNNFIKLFNDYLDIKGKNKNEIIEILSETSKVYSYILDKLPEQEIWKCDLCGEEGSILWGNDQELLNKGWFCTRIRSSKSFTNSVDISRIYISPVFCPICKKDMLRVLKLYEEDGWK